jgi:hypothetical protein
LETTPNREVVMSAEQILRTATVAFLIGVFAYAFWINF